MPKQKPPQPPTHIRLDAYPTVHDVIRIVKMMQYEDRWHRRLRRWLRSWARTKPAAATPVVATPKLEGPGFDALGNAKGVKRQEMTCEHCFSEWTAVTPADAKPGLPVACPNCGGENTPRPGIEVVQ